MSGNRIGIEGVAAGARKANLGQASRRRRLHDLRPIISRAQGQRRLAALRQDREPLATA